MSLVETLKKSKATIIINDTSNANSSSSSNKFAQNQLKKYGWKEGKPSLIKTIPKLPICSLSLSLLFFWNECLFISSYTNV